MGRSDSAAFATALVLLAACAEPAAPAIAPTALATATATSSADAMASPDTAPVASASASASTPPVAPRPPDPVDLKDARQIEVTLAADPARVVAGASTALTLAIRNPGAEPLRFYLYDAAIEIEVLDMRGKRVEPPADPKYVDEARCGGCPSMSYGSRGPPSQTLAPGESLALNGTWAARRRAYPAIVTRKYPACCMPDPPTPRDLGPLPPGTYTVRASASIGAHAPRFVNPVVEAKVEVVAR